MVKGVGSNTACYNLVLLILSSHLSLVVSINTKPIITRQPTDVAGILDSNLSLQCIANGNPKPIITWHNANTQQRIKTLSDDPINFGSIITDTDGQKLTFLEFKKDLSGQYYCNASNSEGFTISNTVSASLAFLEHKFKIEPVSKTALMDSSVELECSAPNGLPKPDIFWRKNGEILSPVEGTMVLGNGYLYIQRASVSDAGEYSCIAKNIAAERQSSSAVLTVKYKPTFVLAPKDTTSSQGYNVTLDCVVRGDPLPTLNWKKENGRIDFTRCRTHSNGSLSIIRVQASDAGRYLCEANNAAGTIEALATLTVNVGPEFLETPANKVSEEGSTVKFQCRVTGNPRPTIYWSKGKSQFIFAKTPNPNSGRTSNSRNDHDLSGIVDRMVVGMDGSLTIYNVRKDDESIYECHATSYIDTIQASASLSVTGKEFLAPIIAFGPQSQKHHRGQDVILNCHIDPDYISNNVGARPVTVWYKDGHPLSVSSSNRFHINLDGSLKIFELQPVDAGNYTCVVKVGAKETQWPTPAVLTVLEGSNQRFEPAVDVSDLPLPPKELQVADQGSDWILLKWDEPIHQINSANSQKLLYQVEYISHDLGSGWQIYNRLSATNVLKIENLRPETSYQFLVRSKNIKGVSKPSTLTNIVRTNSKFEVEKWRYSEIPKYLEKVTFSDISLQVVDKGKIRVMWSVKSDSIAPLRHISGFHIKYKAVPLSRCIDPAKIGSDEKMKYCSFKYQQDLKKHVTSSAAGHSLPDIMTQNSHQEQKRVTVKWRYDLRESGGQNDAVLDNLTPFSCYEITVETFYYQNIYGEIPGSRSQPQVALTWDSTPNSPPQDIDAHWVTNSSLMITWKPPTLTDRNGILIGYTINLIGNSSKFDKRVNVDNGSATSYLVTQLVSTIQYTLHMSAKNCRGEGIRSQPLLLPSAVYSLDSLARKTLLTQPWFISILVIGLVVWIALCILVIFGCRNKCLQRKKDLYKQYKNMSDSGHQPNRPLLMNKDPNSSAESSKYNGFLPKTPDLLEKRTANSQNQNIPGQSFPMCMQTSLPPVAPVATPYASSSLIQSSIRARQNHSNHNQLGNNLNHNLHTSQNSNNSCLYSNAENCSEFNNSCSEYSVSNSDNSEINNLKQSNVSQISLPKFKPPVMNIQQLIPPPPPAPESVLNNYEQNNFLNQFGKGFPLHHHTTHPSHHFSSKSETESSDKDMSGLFAQPLVVRLTNQSPRAHSQTPPGFGVHPLTQSSHSAGFPTNYHQVNSYQHPQLFHNEHEDEMFSSDDGEEVITTTNYPHRFQAGPEGSPAPSSHNTDREGGEHHTRNHLSSSSSSDPAPDFLELLQERSYNQHQQESQLQNQQQNPNNRKHRSKPRHRQPARPVSPYSTDSNYSALPPHKPYPKSDRKRQLKIYGRKPSLPRQNHPPLPPTPNSTTDLPIV